MAKNRPTHVAKPVFPGGISALKKFVAQHLRYPEQAAQAQVQGTVTVRYSLDYRGKVVDTKIKQGLGYGCDEEAMRVVRLLRFEVPQNRKKKVRIHQDLNIHFKLPKPKPAALKKPVAPPATSISIAYTTTKAPAAAPKQSAPTTTKKATTYGYTIKW